MQLQVLRSQATSHLQARALKRMWLGPNAKGLRAGDPDLVLSALGRNPESWEGDVTVLTQL